MIISKKQAGFTILEALIATTIIGVLLILALNSLIDVMRGQLKTKQRMAATRYAIESLELVYNLNVNAGYNSLHSLFNSDLDQTLIFYPDFKPYPNGSALSTDPNFAIVDDIYQREIILSFARRDTNKDLVETGGNLDENTIKAVSVVTWPPEQKIELITYLTDLGE